MTEYYFDQRPRRRHLGDLRIRRGHRQRHDPQIRRRAAGARLQQVLPPGERRQGQRYVAGGQYPGHHRAEMAAVTTASTPGGRTTGRRSSACWKTPSGSTCAQPALGCSRCRSRRYAELKTSGLGLAGPAGRPAGRAGGAGHDPAVRGRGQPQAAGRCGREVRHPEHGGADRRHSSAGRLPASPQGFLRRLHPGLCAAELAARSWAARRLAYTLWGNTTLWIGPLPDTVYDIELIYQSGVPPLGGRRRDQLAPRPNHRTPTSSATLAEAELYIGHDERAPMWLQRREAAFASIEQADRKARWGGPLQIRAHGIQIAPGGAHGGGTGAGRRRRAAIGACRSLQPRSEPDRGTSGGTVRHPGGGQLYVFYLDPTGPPGQWVAATNQPVGASSPVSSA